MDREAWKYLLGWCELGVWRWGTSHTASVSEVITITPCSGLCHLLELLFQELLLWEGAPCSKL